MPQTNDGFAGVHALVKLLEDANPQDTVRVLKEYLEESMHAGFDGFNQADVNGINKFCKDAVVYFKNR